MPRCWSRSQCAQHLGCGFQRLIILAEAEPQKCAIGRLLVERRKWYSGYAVNPGQFVGEIPVLQAADGAVVHQLKVGALRGCEAEPGVRQQAAEGITLGLVE